VTCRRAATRFLERHCEGCVGTNTDKFSSKWRWKWYWFQYKFGI